jgi:hypothetical protein
MKMFRSYCIAAALVTASVGAQIPMSPSPQMFASAYTSTSSAPVTIIENIVQEKVKLVSAPAMGKIDRVVAFSSQPFVTAASCTQGRRETYALVRYYGSGEGNIAYLSEKKDDPIALSVKLFAAANDCTLTPVYEVRDLNSRKEFQEFMARERMKYDDPDLQFALVRVNVRDESRIAVRIAPTRPMILASVTEADQRAPMSHSLKGATKTHLSGAD